MRLAIWTEHYGSKLHALNEKRASNGTRLASPTSAPVKLAFFLGDRVGREGENKNTDQRLIKSVTGFFRNWGNL